MCFTGHRLDTPKRQVGSGMVAHAYNPGTKGSPQAKTSLNYIAKTCVIKEPNNKPKQICKNKQKKSYGLGRNYGRKKCILPRSQRTAWPRNCTPQGASHLSHEHASKPPLGPLWWERWRIRLKRAWYLGYSCWRQKCSEISLGTNDESVSHGSQHCASITPPWNTASQTFFPFDKVEISSLFSY